MKKIALFFCAFILILGLSNVRAESEIVENKYTESTKEVNTFERGFYVPICIGVNEDGSLSYEDESLSNDNLKNKLVHLRIWISDLSENGTSSDGKNHEITQYMIANLNAIMDKIRTNGGTAIVRFSYDDHFNGNKNMEPDDINVILKHIDALKPFFTENEDVISAVDVGFLGPWGELHSSNMATNENISIVTKELFKVVPISRTIGLRTPSQYAYTKNIDIAKIDRDENEAQTNFYRLGIFNDGYLGSANDIGTYRNREIEINWLNKQATHTMFGGEVTDGGTTDVDRNGKAYNSATHMENEMFLTHTSYLNSEWNDKVLKAWKTKYSGSDELYKDLTDYDYIRNHLGYRLVLKESKLPKQVKNNETLDIVVSLKNVGSANIINEKDAYIILKGEKNKFCSLTKFDFRELGSNETCTYTYHLGLSNKIEAGNYEIYMKIINKTEKNSENSNLRTVEFANNEAVFNTELGANKIGEVAILSPNVEKVSKGDLNGDNVIDIRDTTAMKFHIVGLKELTGAYLDAADINEDGKKATAVDLAMLIDYQIGIIKEL